MWCWHSALRRYELPREFDRFREYCQLNLLHQHLALLASVTLLYTACQASQQARFAPEGKRSLLRS